MRAEAGVSSPVTAWTRGALLSLFTAVALACVVLLTLLGHKALTNWDEAIYAEVSREMLASGWLVPHWNGQVWMEKPPLMLWITAAFFKLFGITEFWARAGSALSGVALVALLHRWLMRRDGRLAAWLGTVILLSTFGFLHVCRVGEMDVLLSLGCCVALCGLTAVAGDDPRGWLAFWSGFAIAAMTKGAASIVLPLTAVVLAILDRWGKRRLGKHFWLGLLLFLALVLPWHLLIWLRYRQLFLDEYLGYHVLTRAAHPLEGHLTQGWFYLWVMFVSAMPWVLLYPFAVYASLRRRDLRPWAVFALVVVIFFSVVRTRLPHYIAPVYPVMAMLTAVLIADWLPKEFSVRRPAQRSIKRWAACGAAFLAISATSIALTNGPRGRLHRARDTGAPAVAEEKESVRLLREFFIGTPTARGPLLLWRHDASSIATSVFYSGHRVRQVQLSPPDAALPRDKYTGDAVRLEDAVQPGRSLLLLEEASVPLIPPDLRYQTIARGTTLEIGWIERR